MRIEQLTFTRFIAALAIVIYHFGDHSVLFTNKYVAFLFNQANVGVSYFFVLSGFVMVVAYNDKENINFIEYVKNRLARIYPVYFMALLLYLGNSLLDNLPYEIKRMDLILNLFMLQAWVPSKALTLNYPGWSLSVELFFYLSFPFLFNYIYKKFTLGFVTFWVLLFWLISQILFHLIVKTGVIQIPGFDNKDILYHPLMHFNAFLIGNLAGFYYAQKFKNNKKKYLSPIFFLLFALIFLLKFRFGFNFHNGLLSVIFVPLILCISLSNDKIIASFNNRSLVFLGEISFGIYILQVPIWSIFSDYRLNKYFGLDYINDFTLVFFIRLVVLIIISSLSYLYFEQTIRKKIKNTRIKAVSKI